MTAEPILRMISSVSANYFRQLTTGNGKISAGWVLAWQGLKAKKEGRG
jgi:hypothetical protein